MKHPVADHPRGTVFHLINSFFSRDIDLNLQCQLIPSNESPEDELIASRILRAFNLAKRDEARMNPDNIPNQGVWEMVKHEFHGEAYRLLISGDTKPLARYMCNALRTSWGYGLGPGPDVFKAFETGGDSRAVNILLIKDRLVSLAVALGLLSQEISEQGSYGENIQMDFNELILLIENKIHTNIGIPPVMGSFGVLAGKDKIIDARTPEDVYASQRVLSLSESGVVAEIGGGYGGTSLQFIRSGLTSILFDLPIISALQSFFLIKTLGRDRVALYGEPIDNQKAIVLPWWCFFNRSLAFDVVFNRDSLAEIPQSSTMRYLAEIKDRNIHFLSINQEAESASGQEGVFQLSVSKAASESGLIQKMRFPYWIRRGFVEELY